MSTSSGDDASPRLYGMKIGLELGGESRWGWGAYSGLGGATEGVDMPLLSGDVPGYAPYDDEEE